MRTHVDLWPTLPRPERPPAIARELLLVHFIEKELCAAQVDVVFFARSEMISGRSKNQYPLCFQ